MQNGNRKRQSELREIQEKLSNDNGKNNNGDLKNKNNQISKNKGEIEGSQYFVDPKTGKKYFKRNSQTSQNIYYLSLIHI